ncbi:MAG TPA: DEAD/DEAH box helicase [Verrucomicrobiota bacterium]|nr:DEAD/DEAH box helicase [Verrucomicrobiota bacterium]HNS69025.1 DEAD/DEAH box helicase [Verrucomicrobiota bacterium]
MKLRDYQQEAAERTFAAWDKGLSALVVMATGTGKTVLFAYLILIMLQRNKGKRALVVAHREELIWQAVRTIKKVTGLEPAVEMAELQYGSAMFKPQVVVTTIQTLSARDGPRKRMGRFDPKDFCLLIIDEVHRGVSKTYKEMLHYFKSNNPDIKILGVTGTPDRQDKRGLIEILDECVFEYGVLDAIKDGWLVDIDQQSVLINSLDLSEVKTVAGDFNQAELAEIMERSENMFAVADATMRVIGDKPFILFAPSVRHAQLVSDILNGRKPNCTAWVCGKTNKDERREINRKFANGELQGLCNYGTHVEGYDNPKIEVVVMARPTKSRIVASQSIGRGTRPLPGVVDGLETAEERRAAIAASAKAKLTVLDFVGNCGRHKLVTPADILGEAADPRVVERVKRKAREGKPVNVLDEIAAFTQEEKERKKQEEQRRQRQLAALRVKARFSMQSVDPFDLLQVSPSRKHSSKDWNKTLSFAQRRLLLRQGINPDTMTYSQAKALIDELFRRWKGNLATLGQLKVLKRFGYDNPELSKADASSILEQLAKNGWRRLPVTK